LVRAPAGIRSAKASGRITLPLGSHFLNDSADAMHRDTPGDLGLGPFEVQRPERLEPVSSNTFAALPGSKQ
jgi:hypothetical protein